MVLRALHHGWGLTNQVQISHHLEQHDLGQSYTIADMLMIARLLHRDWGWMDQHLPVVESSTEFRMSCMPCPCHFRLLLGPAINKHYLLLWCLYSCLVVYFHATTWRMETYVLEGSYRGLCTSLNIKCRLCLTKGKQLDLILNVTMDIQSDFPYTNWFHIE